jgi:hypothetical protein
MAGDAFGGGPGASVEFGFQIHEGARDHRDFGTAHETQRVPLLVRVLKLDGHLRVRKHALTLLISYRRTARCEKMIPGRIPGSRFAGDIHSKKGEEIVGGLENGWFLKKKRAIV